MIDLLEEKMSDAHGGEHHEASGDLASQNKFMNRLIGLRKIVDGPVTFFRGLIHFNFRYYKPYS